MAPPDEQSGENHLRFDEPKFEGDGERKQSGVDHKASIYAKPDLENGEEYANLVAYINSYYEGPRRKSVVSMEGDAPKKPWWKFWSRSPKDESSDGTLEIPDDVNIQLMKFCYIAVLTLPGSGSRQISSRVSQIRRSKAVVRRPVSTSW